MSLYMLYEASICRLQESKLLHQEYCLLHWVFCRDSFFWRGEAVLSTIAGGGGAAPVVRVWWAGCYTQNKKRVIVLLSCAKSYRAKVRSRLSIPAQPPVTKFRDNTGEGKECMEYWWWVPWQYQEWQQFCYSIILSTLLGLISLYTFYDYFLPRPLVCYKPI